MTTQQTPDPTGVSLKAAYLLLRELKRYPQLPTIEQLAIILDDVLMYEWAVRIIRLEESPYNQYSPGDGIYDFNRWAEGTLIGPEWLNEFGQHDHDPDPEIFCEVIGRPKPSRYPPPPSETISVNGSTTPEIGAAL